MKDGQVSAGHIHSGSQLLNLVQIGKAKVKAAQVLEREEKSPEKRYRKSWKRGGPTFHIWSLAREERNSNYFFRFQ